MWVSFVSKEGINSAHDAQLNLVLSASAGVHSDLTIHSNASTGATGATGPTGPTGPTGATGPTGQPGRQVQREPRARRVLRRSEGRDGRDRTNGSDGSGCDRGYRSQRARPVPTGPWERMAPLGLRERVRPGQPVRLELKARPVQRARRELPGPQALPAPELQAPPVRKDQQDPPVRQDRLERERRVRRARRVPLEPQGRLGEWHATA